MKAAPWQASCRIVADRRRAQQDARHVSRLANVRASIDMRPPKALQYKKKNAKRIDVTLMDAEPTIVFTPEQIFEVEDLGNSAGLPLTDGNARANVAKDWQAPHTTVDGGVACCKYTSQRAAHLASLESPAWLEQRRPCRHTRASRLAPPCRSTSERVV